MSEYAGLADRARRHHYVDAYTRAMLDQMADAIEALVLERDKASTYLRNLLVHFVKEHFPDNTEWRPLPDLIGMLTQIDNASVIARDYRAKNAALVAERDALRETLRSIAEGNLGEQPWQANYDKIRKVARAALDAPPARQSPVAEETQPRPQAQSPARD